jgi:hypothetical protein
MAAGGSSGGSTGSEKVTGTQLGSQQVGRPATGNTVDTRNGQYTTNTPSSSSSTSGTAGMSAQSSGGPGVVGPTGSRQPDATNPVRSNPSGGGGMDNGANGGSGTGSR